MRASPAEALRLGCNTLLLLLVPPWILLTALLLQFVPSLRGVEMFDPLTGAITFVPYGPVEQLFRGGSFAALLLTMAAPLLVQLLLLGVAGEAASGLLQQRAAMRYAHAVGKVELPYPLIVRKRTRAGAADAIPIALEPAPPWRRLVARGVDDLLVIATAVGSLFSGHFLGLDPLLLAASTTSTLLLARWYALARGSALGRLLVDIHPERLDGAPLAPRHLLLREVFPDLFVIVGATALAPFVDDVGLALLARTGHADRFDLEILAALLPIVGWATLVVLLDLLTGLPLPLSERSLRDHIGGTAMLRVALPTSRPSSRPLLHRSLARALDLTFVVTIAALPVASAVVLPLPPWAVIASAIGLALLADVVLLIDLGMNGTTPGKRLFRLRVIDRDGGTPSPVQVVLVREIMCVQLFWSLLPVVGPLYDVFTGWTDPDLRTLHDRIANTRVVREPADG